MSQSSVQRTVGVLGGMGPYATASFFKTVLDLTPASKDWDHIRIVIDDNPHIPSRSRHFLYGEASPVPGMIDSCRRLSSYPVDFIAVPCNSACYFLKDVRPHVPIPILDIVEVASKRMAELLLRLGTVAPKCAVLGARITYAAKTYERALRDEGVTHVQHGEALQVGVESLIEAIKINRPSDEVQANWEELRRELLRQVEVDGIILGCTELGCLKTNDGKVSLLDSSEALAREVVSLARS